MHILSNVYILPFEFAHNSVHHLKLFFSWLLANGSSS